MTIGAGGVYAADGPLELAGASIISCTTTEGILEFAVKRADVPLFMHYVGRISRRAASHQIR